MKLYRRENYLRKMRGFYHDTGMIKVITRNDFIQYRNGIKHVNVAPFMKDGRIFE